VLLADLPMVFRDSAVAVTLGFAAKWLAAPIFRNRRVNAVLAYLRS